MTAGRSHQIILSNSRTIYYRLRAQHPSDFRHPLRSWASNNPLLPTSHLRSVLPCQPTWSRGASKKSTVRLGEVPLGALPAEPLEQIDDDAPVYPPLLQITKNNMQKFSDCVVLTRVGNFYELYFEHAEVYGPLLHLKLAQRRVSRKTNAPPVTMAGFPYFQLDRFLKILVQDLRKNVAICEEVAKNTVDQVRSDDLKFDRRVMRVVTPGTLIDEKFLDPWENNYLLSIHQCAEMPGQDDVLEIMQGSSEEATSSEGSSVSMGLAWIDLSSGDFFTQRATMAALPSAIARIMPREVVLDGSLSEAYESCLMPLLREDLRTVSLHHNQSGARSDGEWSSILRSRLPDFNQELSSAAEASAGGLLMDFVQKRLPGMEVRFNVPTRREDAEHMGIDRNSMRALEIKKTLRDGNFEGSLLHSVRRTVTQSGGRLLSQRLSSPSLSLATVQDRLDVVSTMVDNIQLREDIVSHLKQSFDSLRLVQKVSFGKGDADDLVALAKTIQLTANIAGILEVHIAYVKTQGGIQIADLHERGNISLESLLSRMTLEGPTHLAERIIDAIDEEALSAQHRAEDSEAAEIAGLAAEVMSTEASDEPIPNKIKAASKRSVLASDTKIDAEEDQDLWMMKPHASLELSRLHDRLDELRQEKSSLAAQLRQRLDSKSLTLRWTPGLGHICHVRGKDSKISLDSLESHRVVSSSKSTKSFYLSAWTKLGGKIDNAIAHIRTEERTLLRQLRQEVVRNLVKLRHNAQVLDELDVACGFATLALERGFVRPILNFGSDHKIIGGRHYSVETALAGQGRTFTANDCHVGADERILLITGPNMAGKSTFLRQNALISILAQTGSFVPCDYAEIGLVDKVFSRVGSADNLYQDQSTFMVEMLETADILRQATERSFVIMDEVGRGTTPQDGIAVGYACLHHLYHTNRCRTLFATHFHSLADMTSGWEKLACYCTDVVEQEEQGSFAYVHKLRKGVNRESHALKVARLAGMPREVVEMAQRVVRGLKDAESATSPPTSMDAHSEGSEVRLEARNARGM